MKKLNFLMVTAMRKILVIAGCGLLAGCVTVEKTRERLASGDACQISRAKSDIRWELLNRCRSSEPDEEWLAYAELMKDNDELLDILRSLSHGSTHQKAVIRQMSFAEEGFAFKFAEECRSGKLRVLYGHSSEDVLPFAIHQMCEQAGFDDLYATTKIAWAGSSENEIIDALLKKASADNQFTKVFFLSRDEERRKKALENVKDQNVLLDCLCTGLEESKANIVAAYLSDETIIEFIRKDVRFVRFAEHKGAHCLCAKMKDPGKLGALLVDLAGPRAELCRSAMKILPDAWLVKIVEEAKNEMLRNLAPYDIRSVQAVERLFCGGKVSAKIQWTLASRLRQGSATRKMYEAASDEKVRKELLEKMPREVRKEIEK